MFFNSGSQTALGNQKDTDKKKILVAQRGLKAATKLKNNLITLIKSRCYRKYLREKTRNSDSVAQASGL